MMLRNRIIMVIAVTTLLLVGLTSGLIQAQAGPFQGRQDQEYWMVTFMSGYSYWQECWRGFKDAADLLGVKASYGGSTRFDLNESLTELEQIAALKPAGIAVTAMDPDAYAPIIDRAIDDGVAVVTFDIDSPKSKRYTFLGTEDYQAGATAARFVAEDLGGKGKVAAIGSITQSNIMARINGFVDTLEADYPNIEVVQVVESGQDDTVAASNATSLLLTNPDIDYVLCALAIASNGAQQAIRELGLQGRVKIITFDTETVTLDAIRDGRIAATISQAPYCQGFWSMVYLYFIHNDLITSVDDWAAKGFPSLPYAADSGSAVVSIDNYEYFYTEGW